jgi:hypothetical protein
MGAPKGQEYVSGTSVISREIHPAYHADPTSHHGGRALTFDLVFFAAQ